MIQVWMDIEAPRYWWQEFDTYKHVEKVSCSTMHKLFERNLKLSDFENGEKNGYYLVDSIIELNRIREEYLINKDKSLLILAKQILPESLLQRRTVNTNYQLQDLINEASHEAIGFTLEIFKEVMHKHFGFGSVRLGRLAKAIHKELGIDEDKTE